LIKKYRKEEISDSNNKYIEVYLGMKDIIESKNYECQGEALKINFYPDESNKNVFIKGNSSDFSRMLSNLLNNAIEAIGSKEGKIEVSYELKGEKVEIMIKDNGKGMPREMVEKINEGKAIGTTKEKGHGIGMEQIIRIVKEMRGKMEVKSKEGESTEFILRFKRVEAPKWFKNKIELHKGDTLVILDDEVLVHEIWEKRLKGNENNINVKYFKEGIKAIEFINSMEDKSKVFLFVDYELKGQGINGINVIEKSGMQERHLIMTSKYLRDIKEFKEKSNFLKMFHKMYLNDVDINVN
jgi:anti-sigma regulatory factor (Ser/Thr protein kinase)